ncbi:MAG: type II secretion system protein [Candidatus Omnitrophota bacterium]
MKRLNQKGFSMIELLVVLLIIGILAAVAAPMFLASSDKAKASEAVAAIGSIRSAERIYAMQHGGSTFLDGEIYGAGSIGTQLGVDLSNAKYLSPESYKVVLATTESTFPVNGATAVVTPNTTVGFVVTADGSKSVQTASASDGKARNASEASNIRAKMDNSGVIVYSTDGGNNWLQW